MERNILENRFIAARRKIIAGDFKSLNDMQQKAVMATEGPLLLLAGAGSGKTTVLINRITNLIRYGRGSDTDEVPQWVGEEELRLLEEAAEGKNQPDEKLRSLCAIEPVEPWRILAITFTNKAADELKARLRAALGDRAEDVWAMTFHSACVRILRRYIEPLGYSRSFTIYDSSDSVAVMKRILKELELDEKVFQPKTVLGYISRAKDAMQSPEDFAEEAAKSHDPRLKYMAKAYAEYSKRLKSADAVDFDDLIYLTVRLLMENSEVLEYYQRFFRYVLVDEYQDTSKLQYKLVSTLAGEYNNICVVGDDDQSIYRFRGATIENILSFEETYKNARTIKLEQNYRSTAHILGAANAVIRHNTGRKGKELWTDLGDGDKPKLYIAESDNEEAQYVAARIIYGVSSGMKWKDFAVLYRMNAQSNRLEYAFKRNNIPYRVVGGMRFFDRAEIKDVTSYLSVVQNPTDDLRLLRIVNNPPRGIGQTAIENMRSIVSREGRPLIDVMRDARLYPELSRSAGKILLFCELLDNLAAASDQIPLDEFYDYLLEKSGYMAALGNTDEALARIDNIKELKSNIVNYMEHNEEPTLAGFLDEIALYTDLDNMDSSDDNVIMMTMHAAKGLEFPWVFVVGMEDGIFPSSRSIGEEEEMEEERRLCYVAMTRAKQELTLTAAKRRMLFGRTTSNLLSRFVDEIPSEHIDRPAESVEPEYGGYDSEPDLEYMEYRHRESNYDRYSGEHRSSYGGNSYGNSGYSSRNPDDAGYIPKYSYTGGGYSSKNSEVRSRPLRPAKEKKTVTPETPAKPKLMNISVGDTVEHKAFGRGQVTAITQMPGDALISVSFEKSGEKRLMLKTAGAFMKKL